MSIDECDLAYRSTACAFNDLLDYSLTDIFVSSLYYWDNNSGR